MSNNNSISGGSSDELKDELNQMDSYSSESDGSENNHVQEDGDVNDSDSYGRVEEIVEFEDDEFDNNEDDVKKSSPIMKVAMAGSAIGVISLAVFLGYGTITKSEVPTLMDNSPVVSAQISAEEERSNQLFSNESISQNATAMTPAAAPVQAAEKTVEQESPNKEIYLDIALDKPNKEPVLDSVPVEAIIQEQSSTGIGAHGNADKKAEAISSEVASTEAVIAETKKSAEYMFGQLTEEERAKLLAPYLDTLNKSINESMLKIAAIIEEKDDSKPAEKGIVRLTSEEKAKLISGKTRLKGFRVINISYDGKMSIVKTPSNRINIYYPGEVFSVRNTGVIAVNSIEDNGFLVLAGDKWFIDEVYESRDTSSDAKNSKSPAKAKVSSPAKSSKEKVKEKAKEKSEGAVIKPYKPTGPVVPAPVIQSKYVSGWVMNAVYPDGFLLQSPTGEWLTFAVGDSISGIGTVHGINSDGDLIVGSKIIKMIKY